MSSHFCTQLIFSTNVCVCKTRFYIKNKVCTRMGWGCFRVAYMLKMVKIGQHSSLGHISVFYHENKVLQISEILSVFEGFMCLLSKTSIRTSNHRFWKFVKMRGQIWAKSYQVLCLSEEMLSQVHFAWTFYTWFSILIFLKYECNGITSHTKHWYMYIPNHSSVGKRKHVKNGKSKHKIAN